MKDLSFFPQFHKRECEADEPDFLFEKLNSLFELLDTQITFTPIPFQHKSALICSEVPEGDKAFPILMLPLQKY